MFRVVGPELAPGELRAVEVAQRRIVLCNAEGRVYALEDRCPHADVALSGGRLDGSVLVRLARAFTTPRELGER